MHIDFEKDGYMVARKFFDDTTIKLMQQYWSLKWNFMNFSDEIRNSFKHSSKKGEQISVDDSDVAYTFNFYGDFLMESIELEYGQKASEILQASISPSYTFTRIYEKGSPLIPHSDREACEISATCPIIISDDQPSQICISKYKWWEVSNKPKKISLEEIKQKGDYSLINLYPGDVCFYKGCERLHWREPIESDYLIQFFMHFVETEGEQKDWVFDKRPYMGFPDSFKDV